MAAISQTTLSNVFPWMKMVNFLIGQYTYRMFPPAIDIIPTPLAVAYSIGKYMNNKANLRELIAATGLVILLKLDSNRQFFSPCDLEIWGRSTAGDSRTVRLRSICKCVYSSVAVTPASWDISWASRAVELTHWRMSSKTETSFLMVSWAADEWKNIMTFCRKLYTTSRDVDAMVAEWEDQGAVSIRKTVLPGMAIPMLKIRRPNGRLIFNMEIAIRR